MQAEKTNKISIYLGWAIKRLVMVLFDILFVNLSYYLALVIRFYVNHEFSMTARGYVPAFWKFAPYHTVICIVVFACFKLYNNRWKHAGLNDLHRMLAANVLTAVIHVAGTLLFVMRMPITYYVIGAALQFVLTTASRFAYRFFVMESVRLKNWNHAKINVMIVGMGETARIFRSQIENDITNVARPVCIFSHLSIHAGEMMNGVPVVTGMDRLTEYIDKYQVKCVILADSLMPIEVRKKIREICQNSKVEVQDFSGYMTRESLGLTAMKLLEHVSGPVDIVVNGLTASFENSEKAMLNLNGNFNVQQIYAKDGKLVIMLTNATIILNDTQENWVKDTEAETGEEISFF